MTTSLSPPAVRQIAIPRSGSPASYMYYERRPSYILPEAPRSNLCADFYFPFAFIEPLLFIGTLYTLPKYGLRTANLAGSLW
jgi:hypothetical protein